MNNIEKLLFLIHSFYSIDIIYKEKYFETTIEENKLTSLLIYILDYINLNGREYKYLHIDYIEKIKNKVHIKINLEKKYELL